MKSYKATNISPNIIGCPLHPPLVRENENFERLGRHPRNDGGHSRTRSGLGANISEAMNYGLLTEAGQSGQFGCLLAVLGRTKVTPYIGLPCPAIKSSFNVVIC